MKISSRHRRLLRYGSLPRLRLFMGTYFICFLILLTSFAEVHLERKFAYIGESFLLFANVTADRPGNEIDLYINGLKDNTLIGSSKFENGAFKFHPKTSYNVSMDKNMNIWILNVDETYTGTYSIFNSSRSAIELIVLESKIVQRGDSFVLFANVTAYSPGNDIQIHILGFKESILIASWKFKNEQLTSDMKIYQNIVMDVDGNISIFNVNENYTGIYSLFKSSRPAIELIVHDNSPTQSVNPSQNTSLVIVCVALAAFVIALILYVAYTRKCRKKKQEPKKNNADVHIEEDDPLVGTPKPENEETYDAKAGTDKVEDPNKKPAVLEGMTGFGILKEETAEIEKFAVSPEKPRFEEDRMNNERLALLEENVHRIQKELESTKETNKTLTDKVKTLENSSRTTSKEERSLKDKTREMTNNRDTNDSENSEHQRNNINRPIDMVVFFPDVSATEVSSPTIEEGQDVFLQINSLLER